MRVPGLFVESRRATPEYYLSGFSASNSLTLYLAGYHARPLSQSVAAGHITSFVMGGIITVGESYLLL